MKHEITAEVLAKDTVLVEWLATHGAGENMGTVVCYADISMDTVQVGRQARLSDGRLVHIGHSSPNQGYAGTRFVTVLAPQPDAGMSSQKPKSASLGM